MGVSSSSHPPCKISSIHMATENTVKVLENCTVSPPPTWPCSATPPLTFFDTFWLRFPPNKRLFFYQAKYTKAFFTSTIIPELKHSLSLTLKHYFPLSGNLVWPQESLEPFVEHVSGDLVSFTVAESQADFHHFTGNGYRRAQEYHTLLPVLLATDDKVPVMALQITLFPNMGFSIGYAIHHVVMDGKSTAMFMHTWAYICKQGGDITLKPVLNPSYDRSSFKSQAEIQKAYLQGWMDQGGPNNKSINPWELKSPEDTMYGTFILTQASIEKIKKWIYKRYQDNNNAESAFHLSSYTITNAFVWVCLVRAQRLSTEKASLVISVDCRARLDPPLPSTYFGNCVLFRMAEVKTEKLMRKDGVIIAAEAIRVAIESLKDGALDGAEGWIYNLFSLQTDGLYSVSGASSFEHYNTDFGWGKPKKVELVSIDEGGAFSISDCSDTDGVEIGVALSEMEIKAFGSLFVNSLSDFS